MKLFLAFFIFLLFGITVYAEEVEEPQELYAQSAVLMDAETGRILFEKNGTDVKAMASTTKIMTCILALEVGDLDAVVTFSDNAQKQPKVHLGATSGEQFYMQDLLYSLMLESHNDSAVAIAETISGDVKTFADLMNQKAKEIGCRNTYFVTPNGLDASDEKGMHSTTAVDLAKIMSYCIEQSAKKDVFLEITATPQHSFRNLDGTKSYSCTNHNAFLNMMDEAISGKTGYTAEAGYCYVGAVESEGRTFVVSLLACGWPNNKNYKWADMKEIISYAMKNYEYQTIEEMPRLKNIRVLNGIAKSEQLFEEATIPVKVIGQEEISVLMNSKERIEVKVAQKEVLNAPVEYEEKVGEISYYLKGEEIARYSIVTDGTAKEKDFSWYFQKIVELYAMQ